METEPRNDVLYGFIYIARKTAAAKFESRVEHAYEIGLGSVSEIRYVSLLFLPKQILHVLKLRIRGKDARELGLGRTEIAFVLPEGVVGVYEYEPIPHLSSRISDPS